jgi:hypothetical protein
MRALDYMLDGWTHLTLQDEEESHKPPTCKQV